MCTCVYRCEYMWVPRVLGSIFFTRYKKILTTDITVDKILRVILIHTIAIFELWRNTITICVF